MRKALAPALVGIGAFLLIAGILAMVWAPGAVKKTPLAVDTTTRLTGEAAKIDTSGQMVTKPIYAQNITMVDSEASTDDIAIFNQNSCVAFGTGGDCFAADDPDKVIVPEDELVTASATIFGTDRDSAEGLKAGDLPKAVADAGGITAEGIVNKFPFDTEKKDYTYWDGTIERGVDATFDRVEKVLDHETYVFKVEVSEESIDVAENTPGTYSDVKEIFVDPATGSIINQTEEQQRWLADGTQVLDLKIGFTEEQVEKNVDDAETNGRSLTLITTVVPLVGLIGGAVLVVVGLLLARRQGGARKREREERPLVSA